MRKVDGQILLVVLGLLFSCTNSPDKIRLKQYTIEGRQLYERHCLNCHQQDGQGLGTLYPPLAQSDFMQADLQRTTCLIRYGLQGSIEVNGTQYNQEMPENPDLTPLQIAEITTYIMNSWGNNTGLVSVRQVEQTLDNCK